MQRNICKMKNPITQIAFASLIVLVASGSIQAGEPASQLPPNARVTIIGDSITMQKTYSKFLETYLLACAGRQDVKCFQFGRSGETASSILAPEDLSLGVFHPTVATFCYGMNDGGSKPYAEAIGKIEAEMPARLVPVKHAIKVEAADALAQDLDLPLERQVVQRNTQEWAEVTVAGPVPANTALVEAKAELPATGLRLRGEPMDWTVVATGDRIKDGKFSGSLKLVTGGWYQLAVRFRKSAEDPTVLAQASVGQVGVGDIFITAGQSNSVNFGQPKQKSAEDLCVYFDGKRFTPAADPMPDAIGVGGTPWPILGDMLSRTTRAPVCFRSATTNVSRIQEWVPSSPGRIGQIERLVELAKWFGPRGIRAVLWVQGEADTDDPGKLLPTPPADYERDAKAMIEFSRKQLGWPVDWFVAGNSYIPAKPGKDYRKNIADILGAQKALWDQGIAFRGPDTNDLVGSPDYRHDGVHFGPRGLQVHAERWYAALNSQYQWANPVTGKNK